MRPVSASSFLATATVGNLPSATTVSFLAHRRRHAAVASRDFFCVPFGGGASMGASADRVHLLKAATAATLIAAMPTSTITSATDNTTLAAAQTAAALAVADVASSVLATSTSASSTFTTTALGAALAAAQAARHRSSPPPPSRRCHPCHRRPHSLQRHFHPRHLLVNRLRHRLPAFVSTQISLEISPLVALIAEKIVKLLRRPHGVAFSLDVGAHERQATIEAFLLSRHAPRHRAHTLLFRCSY